MGTIYYCVDRHLDRFACGRDSLEEVTEIYAENLEQSIIRAENRVFKEKEYPSKYMNSRYENQNKIANYYNYLMNENVTDRYSRLKDAIMILDKEFIEYRSRSDEFGIDSIDFKYLYRDFLYRSVKMFAPCFSVSKFQTRSIFNDSLNMYITKLVSPQSPNRFLLIYRGHSYRIVGSKLKINFSKEDVERGYANVIIRDLINYSEIEHRIEIPSYAFKV